MINEAIIEKMVECFSNMAVAERMNRLSAGEIPVVFFPWMYSVTDLHLPFCCHN